MAKNAQKTVFAKFNEEIAKKVLSKGATLPITGKILGNPTYLSQTKNKKKIGLDEFSFSGRPAKGRPRIYYSESEMNEGELVYPISEMNDFNSRLADELFFFHLFGYSIKALDYERGHKIARITFVEADENNSCDEFQITFLDLSEVRYLKISPESNFDRNLFILPTHNEEDLENVAISQEQKALLSLGENDYSILVATYVGNTEYYEINKNGGTILRTHSFLKRNGIYDSGLLKFDLSAPEQQSEKIVDYQIITDDRKAQMTANGFALSDGRISELDNKNSQIDLSEYGIFLLDQFKDEYVIANRYFDKRYLTDGRKDTSSIDQILDDVAASLNPKEIDVSTFAELEIIEFDEYLESEDSDEDMDEVGSNDISEQFGDIFSAKQQGGEIDDRVQTGKLEDKPSSTEDITPISGNTEDKDLPSSHEEIDNSQSHEETKEESKSESVESEEAATKVSEAEAVPEESKHEEAHENNEQSHGELLGSAKF